jgi:hypothetical protein
LGGDKKMNAWGQIIAQHAKPILKAPEPLREPPKYFERQCSVCKETKSVSEFYARVDKPGTFASRCRKCLSKINSERQAKKRAVTQWRADVNARLEASLKTKRGD